MSKQFSKFTSGNPPLDTDKFLLGRVDGASPTGFSNYTVTWAQLKALLLVSSLYAPGSFTIPNGAYVDMSRMLQLTGAQVVTGLGNAQLRIS